MTSNTMALLVAACDVLPDLERFCAQQGPGPDLRLAALRAAVSALAPCGATRTATPAVAPTATPAVAPTATPAVTATTPRDVKFHKYYATNGKVKARVHYSLDTRIDGRKCVTIYHKDYTDSMYQVFKGHGVYENRTDTMTDLFDKGTVRLFEDHALYAAARARAEANHS